jgi:predicted AAA+ superfamily ATPase
MQRTAETYLRRWAQKPDSLRSPLLIRGARQVGKTYLVEKVGAESFEEVITLNFEQVPKATGCFETLDPIQIIKNLQVLLGRMITPGKALLFLDEIQMCPEAILVLRYFKEQLPELAVVAAGSLLEFTLNDESFRMPVGRVEFLYLYPLSFKEFLLALEEKPLVEWIESFVPSEKNTIPEAIHDKALSLVRDYSMIGGMPEVVAHYINNRLDTQEFQNQQGKLLLGYRLDFPKYAKSRKQQLHLNQVFDHLSQFIAEQVTYSKIAPELTSAYTKEALRLLKLAGLCHFIYGSSGAGIPLGANQNPKKLKLLYLDIGLYLRDLKLHPETLLQKKIDLINSGVLAEQFVGQELLTQEPLFENAELYFWARDKTASQAEVDYLCQIHDKIIPIEVKAGASKHLKSMHLFKETYQSPFGIRISSLPGCSLETPEWKEDRVFSIPLYLTSEVKRLGFRLI